MKHRQKAAVKAGYRCYAHRYDNSFKYMQQMRENNVPREVELQRTEKRTGLCRMPSISA